MDALGALLSCVLAVYLVYYRGQSASNTGFSLNMAGEGMRLVIYHISNQTSSRSRLQLFDSVVGSYTQRV